MRKASNPGRARGNLAATCLILLSAIAFVPASQAEEALQFNRDIRPILSQNCFRCHGPDEGNREADLRLDQEAGIRKVFGGGLNKSEAWHRIHSDDADEQMPPADSNLKLTPAQKQRIGEWIQQGTPWQGHWAFIPPQRPAVPKVKLAERVINPIDAFILARLEKEGVSPVPQAGRATLLRRLSLDLVGLPPTGEDVKAFIADGSPQAYERAVDRLLDSQHFGERMAVYWLDLVRYADSVGYHKDSHRNCWLYRDYVVQAFNDNKPYDEFVKEQLAGDLLEGSKFEKLRWKVASGLNRMNQTTSEGGAQAKEYLAKYSADRVRNTAAIFLGTTMGCSECHDHKYDPISTKDFYSFAAFFADLQERGVGFPGETPMPTLEQISAWEKLDGQLQAQRKLLESVTGSGADGAAVAKIEEKIKSIEQQIKPLADQKNWQKTLVTVSGKPRTIRVLPRGNWLSDSGPVVQPAIPESFGSLDVGDRRATRIDLAEWITSRDNPLTARVLVNRLWKLMMGEGICRTLDDLGSQGEWPTHGELLDWLAMELIDSGWDVKHIMKLIAMSDTYRRSSVCPEALRQRDPENRLFARQASFRLNAEFVRDNALAISGLLSSKIGGRSVKPYQPANYWYRLYKDGKYVSDKGEDQYRRGLYTYWRRSFWHPSLRAFDAPAREECVAQRPRSNTPQQSLVLLNDPTYIEAARVLAAQMMEAGNDPKAAIEWAYWRAVARAPSEQEIAALSGLHEKQRKRYEADEKAAAQFVGVGEYPLPKNVNPAQLAAWTSVARVILNLHETITRN